MKLKQAFLLVPALVALVAAPGAPVLGQDGDDGVATPATISAEVTDEAPPQADAPPKIAQRPYAKWLVNEAVERYDADGREASLAYFNSPEALDGQWYVFVVSEAGMLIGNANRPDLLNTSTRDTVDVNGKPFGLEIVAADENGRWVDYHFTEPVSREQIQKHSWVVRHDGLFFGTGWYEVGDPPAQSDVGNYTYWLVAQAIDYFDANGREATLERYNSPELVDGQWYVYMIDTEGFAIANSNRPDIVGTSTAERVDIRGKPFGRELVAADENGDWVDYYFRNPDTGEEERKHSWVVRYDDVIFGSGWYTVPEAAPDSFDTDAADTADDTDEPASETDTEDVNAGEAPADDTDEPASEAPADDTGPPPEQATG